MINLFQIAKNDASVGYLADIFGSMNGVLNVGSNLNNPPGSTTILSAMFRTFNTTILVVAVLMLVYVTVVGVMMTAHEGEFMGKKWNNIWIPLRAVAGIALMVPTASGYSVLQVIMMWVIVQGIGAADTVWNTALKYVQVMGSVYAQGAISPTNITPAFNGLFQGLVCTETARIGIATGKGYAPYYCAKKGKSAKKFCSSPVAFNPNQAQLRLGPNEYNCGTFTYCNPGPKGPCGGNKSNSLTCLACRAQISALSQIVPTLATIASNVANADVSYVTFYGASGGGFISRPWVQDWCTAQDIGPEDCCVKSSSPFSMCKEGADLPRPFYQGNKVSTSDEAMRMYWEYYPSLGPALGKDPEFIATATNYFMDAVNSVYSTYIATQANKPIGGPLQSAQDKGWIWAGGFYWDVAQHNTSNLKEAIPSLSWDAPTMTSDFMKNYRNNWSAATVLTTGAGGGGMTSGIATSTISSVNSVKASFAESVTNRGSNPLYGMQIAGAVMLNVASALIIALIVIFIAVAIVGNLSVFVLGTGIDNPVGPTQFLLVVFIMPAIYGLLGLLIALGGTLAIYIPLIPFMVFTFGALGWMISTIVALVAAPLVSLGIISPSGNHELLGKAEPALMLLFSIFLRPALMVFGLIAAMLLSSAVVKMVNAIFWSPHIIEHTAATAPLLGFILLLCAYVSFLVLVLNKTFAVINLVPQQVMSWIGGQGEAVEAPHEAVKGAIEAGGKGAGAAADRRSEAKEEKGRQEAVKAAVKKEEEKSKLKAQGGGGGGGQ